EARIAELDECARTQESIANKPPGDTISPGGSNSTTTDAQTGTGPDVASEEGDDLGEDGEVEEDDGETDGGEVTAQVFAEPRVINARIVGGAGKVAMGDLPTGFKPSFQLTGGYPVYVQG